jgi:predicted nucleic acid-binding protein
VAGVAYLDSSAIVKTVIREPESAALRRALRRFPIHASAALARAEVVRAVRRADPQALRRAYDAVGKLLLIELDDSLLDSAGILDPPDIRTLDAIHLTAAQALAPELGVLITYDERMTKAAAALGFQVEAPA